jgi:ABC-type antimicrobial peptide transport system permease subunit
MLNKSFIKLFFKPEFGVLAGKKFLNLLVLIMILTISMLSIGLGNGVVEYMKEKMNNVFVSIIEVTVPSGNTSVSLNDESLNEKFSDLLKGDDYKKYFNIKEPFPNYANYFLVSKPNGENVQFKCQMALNTDPYIKKINEGNLNESLKFRPDQELGCVISESVRKKLDIDREEVSYLFLRKKIGDTFQSFPIPIRAIVPKMPNDIDIFLGRSAYNLIEKDLYNQKISADTLLSNLLIFIPNHSKVTHNYLKFPGDVEKYCSNLSDGELFVWPNPNDNYNEVLDKLQSFESQGIFHFKKYFHIDNLDAVIDNISKENYAVQFVDGKMDKVEELADFLKYNYGLKVDMNTIEEKNNFDLFNKVAQLLSFALIIFSVFSMVLFITNLIVSHISKNRKNLGTLKAFGMSNNDVIYVYSSISVLIILIAFFVSFLISSAVGNLIVESVAGIFNIKNPQDLSYERYSFVKLLLFFVITPLIFVVLKLFTSLHGSTPGDLIYER